MPKIEIDFDVYCTCGNGICRNTEVKYMTGGGIELKVEPCEDCIKQADGKGYDRGIQEGSDR